MNRSALFLVVPLVLIGCRQSTKSISLRDGTFQIGQAKPVVNFYPMFFSQDGSLMGGLAGTEDTLFFEARKTDTGEKVARLALTDHEFLPVLFTQDGLSVVMLGQVDEELKSQVLPLRLEMAGIESEAGMPFSNWLDGHNHDSTLFADSFRDKGYVVTNTGQVVLVSEPAENMPPFFDMYGSVWFPLKKGGWATVSKQGQLTKAARRPGYLVVNPSAHRGSMHLAKTSETMEFEGAEALVSCLWLHHDQALTKQQKKQEPYNTSALVRVGDDIRVCGFVPGRDEILVIDADGAVFVPFSMRPPDDD